MKIIKKRNPIEYIIYTAIIGIGILLDQITKILASSFLKPIYDVPLIRDVFHLTYTENRGAAFGMLSEDRWVFMTFSSVMIIAMCDYLFFPKKNARPLFGIAMAIVISGGIGNMIDRVASGFVVDFFYFKLINFAIFNVADVFVCVGAGLMVLDVILEIIEESKKEKAKKNDL